MREVGGRRKEEQRVAGEKGTANQPVGASALALVSRRFKDHGVARCQRCGHAALTAADSGLPAAVAGTELT
jgi:hypothetical protein